MNSEVEMKNRIVWIFYALAHCLFLVFASWSFAGREVGNGGDYIRGTFIRVGGTVIKFLDENPAGQKIVQENHLKLDELRGQLSTDHISVTAELLRDNTGSRVDAIGIPGSIQLSDLSWTEHFENNRDVYYLVLHELLRAAGVNDDDYVISSKINPFPTALRFSTKLVNVGVPLPAEDLTKVMQIGTIGFGGNGCPSAGLGTVIEFDPIRGTLELALRKFTVTTLSSSLDRKSCAIAVPLKLAPNQRLVLSQVDLASQLALNPGAQFQTRVETFLAGQTGPVIKKTYKAEGSQHVSGLSLMRETQLVKTECGDNTNLRVNTSGLLMQTTGVSRSNISIVDVNRITLYLKIESCI